MHVNIIRGELWVKPEILKHNLIQMEIRLILRATAAALNSVLNAALSLCVCVCVYVLHRLCAVIVYVSLCR